MLTAYYVSGAFLLCFVHHAYARGSTKVAFTSLRGSPLMIPTSSRRTTLAVFQHSLFQLLLNSKLAEDFDKSEAYEQSENSLNSTIEESLAFALLTPVLGSPTAGKSSQPSKTDLYSSEELQNLLTIHNSLSRVQPGFYSPSPERQGVQSETNFVSSLQDLIVQAVEDIDAVADENLFGSLQHQCRLKFESHYKLSDFERILPNIRAIACDVDGTLLSSDHSLHPFTKQAIKNAVEAAFSPMHPLQYFFPATGKTRAGALRSLGHEMQTLLRQVPGVYVQGLYCIDASGKVIFEKKLAVIAVEEAQALAERCGVSLVAYDGDFLFVTSSTLARHVDEISTRWGEPVPTQLEGSIVDHKPCFHKILLMGDDAEQLAKVVRPQLEALAASLDCVVTQAVPTMLELLPAGCSKAVGVQKLCEAVGLDLSTQVCAIGDAENDIEMLRLAAIGVAVGNAAPAVKAAATVVLEETNNQGGAGRAIQLFGLGEALLQSIETKQQ